MDVGGGCTISDKWILKDIPTGLLDINGKEIKTSNVVKLNGCRSSRAVVGKTEEGKFALYFGVEGVSVRWWLDDKSIKQHSIQVIQANS